MMPSVSVVLTSVRFLESTIGGDRYELRYADGSSERRCVSTPQDIERLRKDVLTAEANRKLDQL